MKKLGFELLSTEGCLFKTLRGALLLLYVDDIRIVANTTSDIDITVNKLGSIFELKKMGEALTFLGYSITRDYDNRVIYLS